MRFAFNIVVYVFLLALAIVSAWRGDGWSALVFGLLVGASAGLDFADWTEEP